MRLEELTGPLEANEVLDAILNGRLLRWRATSETVSRLCERMTMEHALARIERGREKVLVRVPLDDGSLSPRHALDGKAAVRLFSAFDGGGAIQVVRAEDPALALLSEEIAADLDLPDQNVCLGMFVAKAGHVTPLHNDDVPGISIQLSGTKTWSFSSVLTSPNRPFEAEAHLTDGSWEHAPEELDNTFVVEPGDGMTVPSGLWHEVRSDTDGVSILASISFAGVRWVDALGETIRRILVESPIARTTWLHGGVVTREHRLAQAEELLALLRSEIAKLDVAGLLEDAGAPLLEATQRFRWNPASFHRPTADGRLRFGVAGFLPETGVCRLPPNAERAFAHARSLGQFTVADLSPFFRSDSAALRFISVLVDLKAVIVEPLENALGHVAA